MGCGYRWCWPLLIVLTTGCGAAQEPSTPATAEEPSDAASVAWESVGPDPPSSFTTAKRLALDLYSDHRLTFYCGCDYATDKSINADACGYVPRNDNTRSRRIEWEHMVPASAFGSHRECWTDDICETASGEKFHGRSCCGRTDDEFAAMEADLQNLVPSVGELNADRSDRPYGDAEGEPRAYGDCDFEVDFEADVAEPAESLRGDVARSYLYLSGVYGADALPLSDAELAKFWAWHAEDPPDDWERERNRRITGIQGVGNPLVE